MLTELPITLQYSKAGVCPETGETLPQEEGRKEPIPKDCCLATRQVHLYMHACMLARTHTHTRGGEMCEVMA